MTSITEPLDAFVAAIDAACNDHMLFGDTFNSECARIIDEHIDNLRALAERLADPDPVRVIVDMTGGVPQGALADVGGVEVRIVCFDIDMWDDPRCEDTNGALFVRLEPPHELNPVRVAELFDAPSEDGEGSEGEE